MKKGLGPCVCGCGRRAEMPKHRLARACYSSMRVWSNVKTPRERAQYMLKLLTRHHRLQLIEEKEVVIGTSPFKWRRRESNVLPFTGQMRRQRGSVR